MKQKRVCCVLLALLLLAAAGCAAQQSTVAADKTQLMKIETEIIDLYYPQRWEDNLTVVTDVAGKLGTVQFYAIFGQDRELVFTVEFGGDGEIYLGSVRKGSEEIPMVLHYAEPTFDGQWSSEEQETYWTMQEDVNYLLAALKENKAFSAAKP